MGVSPLIKHENLAYISLGNRTTSGRSAAVEKSRLTNRGKSRTTFCSTQGPPSRSKLLFNRCALNGPERVSKHGDAYLRTLLIHGARSVIRVAERKANHAGSWLANLMGRRHKNVIAVALANKNARIVWVLNDPVWATTRLVVARHWLEHHLE